MSANIPIVRRIAWSYTVPHLLLMFGLILFLWQVLFPGKLTLAMLSGALAYLAYSFGSKAILLRRHKRGIGLSRLGLFREAIAEFGASYLFLSNYPWLDEYRFFTMLDSSAVPYREMALCNIAFSHLQLDERAEAREYYRKALDEFPKSEMARDGLVYVESVG